MNSTPEHGHAFIHDTGHYSHPPLLNDPNQQLPYPQYPSFAPQYPGYYLAPAPAPPSFPDPYPPLPPGARILSPPRAPTADELKYKCSICGRFRSPRFHYKHPIPPGQLPAQTVCRKCRQTGTDSEDTSDEQVRFRGLQRSRSVVSIAEPIRTRFVSDADSPVLRERSSRVSFAPRSRSRRRGRLRKRSTSSTSFDSDDLEILEKVHPKRPRARSVSRIVERVRYIEESPPPRPSPPRQTIYIEEDRALRPRRASRYEEGYFTEYDSEEEYIPRKCVIHVSHLSCRYANPMTLFRRIVSRAPSLTPVSRRQYAEPFVRERVRVKTRDLFDGQDSVFEESIIAGKPARPLPDLLPDLHILRVSDDEAQRIRQRLASSDEYEIVADRPILRPHQRDKDLYEDEARRSKHERQHRRRSRSRAASSGHPNDGERIPIPTSRRRQHYTDSLSSDYMDTPRILPRVRVPTPPPADRRSSARYPVTPHPQGEDVEIRRTSQHEPVDRQGRPIAIKGRTRLRSRSTSQSRSRWNAPFGGRPPRTDNETIEMQERIQAHPATEDYDWYDSHGQRVRVREI
jgi:hypothetical protein